MSRRNLSDIADQVVAKLDGEPRGRDVSNEPRVPAGHGRESGRWTREAFSEKRRDRARKDPQNEFFEIMDPIAQRMAAQLGIPDTWILGLSAHESHWMDKHARDQNNPFGVTRKGGHNAEYESPQEAANYWSKRFGPAVTGASTPQDFVNRLYDQGYNTSDPNWRSGVLQGIRSVDVRQQVRDAP